MVAIYKLFFIIRGSTYGSSFLQKKSKNRNRKKNADPKNIEGLIIN